LPQPCAAAGAVSRFALIRRLLAWRGAATKIRHSTGSSPEAAVPEAAAPSRALRRRLRFLKLRYKNSYWGLSKFDLVLGFSFFLKSQVDSNFLSIGNNSCFYDVDVGVEDRP
jgi:hypothetical protein